MAFLLYQITNLTNGHYYIGAHEGEPDDAYFGSGIILKKAIRKYGLTQFRKDILAELPTKKLMYALEAAVVNEEFVARPDTYNCRTGGQVEWTHSSASRKKMSGSQKRRFSNPTNRLAVQKQIAELRQTPIFQSAYENRGKEFEMVRPRGETFRTRHMRKFCQAHGLFFQGMYLVAKGTAKHSKGWTCKRVSL